VSESSRLYTSTFWTACAIHFTGGMSLSMFLLLPLFIRALGGEELLIGLVLGVGMAASVALRPTIGTLLDRAGRRRVLVWAGLVNVASYPPFLLLRSTGPALWALATLHLVVHGALFAAYFTYVSDLVPPARRAEGIAIFGVAGMATNGLGPALGEALTARGGWTAFYLAATAFAAVSAALSSRVAPGGPRASAHEVPATLPAGILRAAAQTIRHGGLAPVLVVTILFGAGINAAFYFVAPFTRAVGVAHAAPFFAAYASTTIGLRIGSRRVLDRLGPHRVAVPAFAVFAAGLAALTVVPRPGALLVAGIACGAGHGTLFPVLNALAVSRTPPHLHGTTVSLYTAAMDLGGVVGTPLCGALARLFGYRTMFAAVALASVLAVTLMRADARRGR